MNSLADAPDAALLVAYANGDAQAAQVLAHRLLPAVLGQATRMLSDRSEAEDVAQEAMMRLWKVAPDWRQNEAKVSTWMYRVVANLCTDKLRKRRGKVGLDQVAEVYDDAPTAVETMQANTRMIALKDALSQLPERQAQAVALRHLEGLSNPEIAEIMDITVMAVENLTTRGKRALSRILSGQKEALGFQDDTF